MALKNLFDMVKADRYTADGREAIIKAQEEETEDKVYQIGEISQKTGLQKTANGWVKPKNGKQPGAKKENPTRTFEFKSGPDGMPVAGSGKEVKTYKTKKEAEAALKKQNAAAGNKPVEQMSINELKEKRDILKNGSGKENDLQYKKINDELAKKRLQKLSVGQEVKVDGKPVKITNINPDTNRVDIEFKSSDTGETMKSHIGLENIDNYESIGETENKPAEKTGFEDKSIFELQDIYNSNEGKNLEGPVKEQHEKIAKELQKRITNEPTKNKGFKKGDIVYNRNGERSNVLATAGEYILTENRGRKEWMREGSFEGKVNNSPRDAAPRVLTGDTRIRVRKA